MAWTDPNVEKLDAEEKEDGAVEGADGATATAAMAPAAVRHQFDMSACDRCEI